MKQVFIFFLFSGMLISQLGMKAQEVYIYDLKSQQPIPFASIVELESQQFTQSDEKGLFILDDLWGNPPKNLSSLHFLISHPSYQDSLITYLELEAYSFEIYLNEKVINLEEFVVYANRWASAPENNFEQITSITSKDIRNLNPPTAAHALENSGEVFVQRSQQGGGSPMLRGFGANAVLLVVDGMRMNNAIFRGGNLQNVISLDPGMLERVDVIYGPGSVLYGSDALGGVMHFTTRSPSYATSDNREVDGEAYVRYASAAHEKQVGANISINDQKWASFTHIGISDFSDLRAGSWRRGPYEGFGFRNQYWVREGDEDRLVENPNPNRQISSGYSQANLLQKFSFKLTPEWDLKLSSYFSTTTDIPRYDRLDEPDANGIPRAAEWFYGPQHYFWQQVEVEQQSTKLLHDRVRLSMAYQFMEESRHDRRALEEVLRSRAEGVNVALVNLDFLKNSQSNWELYYGGEWVGNWVQSRAFQKNLVSQELLPLPTRYPAGGSFYATLAAYASTLYKPTNQLTLKSGLRYTQINLESNFAGSDPPLPFESLSIHAGALNGQFGITWRPMSTWKIATGVSTGFRAPNVDDAAKIFDSEPGFVVVPNPDLQPEESINAEFSISKKFGKSIQLEGVVFRSWLRNAMVRRNFTFQGQDSILYDGRISQVQALVNTQSANIQGFTLRAKWKVTRQWHINGSYTRMRGEDEEGENLRHVSPDFGQVSMDYFFTSDADQNFLSFFLRYQGGIPFDRLPPSEQNKVFMYPAFGAAPWWTINLIFQRELPRNFLLNLGVENILDKHYRSYSSGISAPGINATATLRKFF